MQNWKRYTGPASGRKGSWGQPGMEVIMLKQGVLLGALLGATFLVPLRAPCQSPCESMPYHYEAIDEGKGDAPQMERRATEFLNRHAMDQLVTVWPQKPYVIGVVTICGKAIYELTCSKFGPFDHSLTVTPTQTFLVYENKDGALSRINVSPHKWSGWEPGGAFIAESLNSIGLFKRFLRTLTNYKALSIREQAFLFVSLIGHEAASEFPCVIYSSLRPISDSTQPPEMLDRYKTALAESPGGVALGGKEKTLLLVAQYPITNSLVQFYITFSPRDELRGVYLRRLQ